MWMPSVTPAVTQSDIDMRIELWHTMDDDSVSLINYLGWTDDQYSLWIEQGIKPYEGE